MNVLWCAKSANPSQDNSKGPCEDAGGNRYNVSICTVDQFLYRHNLKGRSARKKATIIRFGEMSSGLKKQKKKCLAIMTIVMFGGKRGRLAIRRTPSQL
jgi:hypothetical protein